MTFARTIRLRGEGRGRNHTFEISLFIFAIDLVYGIVAPTFSLFVHGLGGSAALVGVLTGTVGLTRLLGSLPVGVLSDHWGRKIILVGGAARRVASGRLMVAALGVDAVAAFGICFSFAAPVLLVSAIVDGIAFGVFLSSSQSVVAAHADARQRGAAIGTYAMGGAVGETIGALSFGFVAQFLGLRTIFAVSGALLAASTPIVWRLVARLPPDEDATAAAFESGAAQP